MITKKGPRGTKSSVNQEGGVLTMYYVGIDISKYKHDCFIQNENGEVIYNTFTFSNNKEGFTLLLERLKSLDQSQKIKIGLEATGHYGDNLKPFLEQNGYDFMEINPLLISNFISANSLRRTKTDKADSQSISLYLMTVEYKPYPVKSYHIQDLKSLTRTRENLIKERSKYLIRITNVLDKIFPEFKPFFKENLKSATCMYILNKYLTPQKISRMNINSYNEMKSELRHTISYTQFLYLRDLAKDTVGNCNDILEFELKTLLQLYNNLDQSIEDIDTKITNIMNYYQFKITGFKGVGIISAASFVAEVGDINRFNNPNQLLAFAGLEPSTIESGTMNNKGKMVKHGSSYLRQTIMNIASFSIIHNPVLADYYHKKRNEGKCHRVALSHLCRKLVRIFYILETKQMDFNINLMR